MKDHHFGNKIYLAGTIALALMLLAAPLYAAAAGVYKLAFTPSPASPGFSGSTANAAVGAGSWYYVKPGGAAKAEFYLAPASVGAPDFTIDEIASISYQTNNAVVVPNLDFYIAVYTMPCSGGDASGYCHRLNAEPYFSINPQAKTAGVWNTYATDSVNNQLTFFDQLRCGAMGVMVGQPTLAVLQAGPFDWDSVAACPSTNVDPVDYGPEVVKYITFQTGSGWTAFEAYLDNITITLTNGNSYQIDLEGPQSEVWVDDSWASSTPGQEVASGQYFGVNAFATITDGFNGVSEGGKINVLAGVYRENLLVNKTVELAGAGAASVTWQPGVSEPNPTGCVGSICAGSSNIVIVGANNVKIHGFTIDGDNPILTSGVNVGGANIDARNGIITNHPAGIFNGLEIYENTVKNIYLRGIYASSGGTFNIHHNVVQNVKAENASIAIFNFGGSGVFEANTVSDVGDAISANWSKGTQFLNNVIRDASSGIHTDNSQAPGDLIQDNLVEDCKANGYGVWVYASDASATVNHNTVRNCTRGLGAFGTRAGSISTFTNNTAVGPNKAPNSVGAYVSTDLFYYGYEPVTAVFTGNSISNFDVGVYLDGDEHSSYNHKPYPTPPAGVTATFHDNAIFDNATGGDKGANPDVPMTVDLTQNFWGDASGPLDSAGSSEVLPCSGSAATDLNADGLGNSVADGLLYCPWANSIPAAALQAAVDGACGGVLQLGPFTYTGGIELACKITVNGVPGTVFTPGSPAFTVTANDVIIQNMTIDMSGDLTSNAIETGADVSGLVIKNVEIMNTGGHAVNLGHNVTNFRLVDSYIHDNPGGGLYYAAGTQVGGVHEVMGNLFMGNAFGVQNASAFTYNVAYNSWGHLDGPAAGDAAIGSLTTAPFTHAAGDMLSSDSPIADKVAVGQTIVYTIRMDAANLTGADFDVTFDNSKVQVNSVTMMGAFPQQAVGSCDLTFDNPNGVIHFCGYTGTALSGAAQPVYQVTFQGLAAGVTPLHFVTTGDLYAMVPGYGASTNVYPAGYTDGSLEVFGLFNVVGRIDLQGRANDTGAVLAFGLGVNQGYGPYTSAASDYWGVVNLTNVVADTYQVTVEMDRYLDVDAASNKLVTIDSLKTGLNPLFLLGGDVNDDAVINVLDAQAIGLDYGKSSGFADINSDINNDGVVNILDIVMVGVNFSRDSTWYVLNWTP